MICSVILQVHNTLNLLVAVLLWIMRIVCFYNIFVRLSFSCFCSLHNLTHLCFPYLSFFPLIGNLTKRVETLVCGRFRTVHPPSIRRVPPPGRSERIHRRSTVRDTPMPLRSLQVSVVTPVSGDVVVNADNAFLFLLLRHHRTTGPLRQVSPVA